MVFSKANVFYYTTYVTAACTDKNENEIFFIFTVRKFGWYRLRSHIHMKKCFLIYEELRKYLTIYEEAVSCVLEVRPARRTDASAPLSAGVASPPPLLAVGR